MSERLELPIDVALPRILDELALCRNIVIHASPGSGKTTRVPPYLLGASWRRPEQEILVLEPRRLAAKWAARRVAEELGESLGKTVGYQFRFENVGSSSTRLRFLTEGMLMRRLLSDPLLKGVAAVVLDEFHERHLQTDLAIGYLRWLQQGERKDLRLVVMSATLDHEAVAGYLGNCPVTRVDARRFPIELEYLQAPAAKRIEFMVRDSVRDAVSSGAEGDFLVFLPGMAEIRRCEELLRSLDFGRFVVLPLHGDLSREDQDRAMQKGPDRKIILATNIAETSLTIDGVGVVIDSGLHRLASYSWWSGLPSLKTRAISRASAAQRMGRAGRTGPGRCYRLYTKGDYESRAPFDRPEIQRADISQSYLELKALGISRVELFPWYEAPSKELLKGTRELLFRLGALECFEEDAMLTRLGREMTLLPAHPRLARMLLEARRNGSVHEALNLASLIMEGELESLDALDAAVSFEHRVRAGRGGERILKTRRHLMNSLGPVPDSKGQDDGTASEALARAVLAGFPDRVARNRALPSNASMNRQGRVAPAHVPLMELVFATGGSAVVENAGVLASSQAGQGGQAGEAGETGSSAFFVVIDVQEQSFQGENRSRLKIRSVCPIRAEWLFDLQPFGVSETDEVAWDADREEVVRLSTLKYDQLLLAQSRESPRDPDRTLVVLLKSGLKVDPERMETMGSGDWVQILGALQKGAAASESLEGFFARLSLFSEFQAKTSCCPSNAEGGLSGRVLWNLIKPLLTGITRLRELKEKNIAQELQHALLGSEFCAAPGPGIDALLPLSVVLPRGRRVKIHYQLGQPPWTESRIQDFFGMKAGPTVLQGRVPLTLHLLAPNQRAVQVTSDLSGFWERDYPAIRNELCRRYPKHAWPLDPHSPPSPSAKGGQR
ncbi:MAG: hypothetical protein A2428_14745 [Bdellovibrionales bacterium RIFOXYC1_FULL_54_43]|nr:MAG: hypothetical protein A2428_14745 [Bdellovibrionales bacterium RIFOXYC1_FULL_54_43]